MVPLQDFPAYLLELAFKEDATAYELLTVALAFSVLWGLVFAIARPLLRSVTYGRPWLRSACERDYERGGKDLMEAFGFKGSKEEAIEKMMKNWAGNQVMMFQHAAGGILCIPSLLGYGDPSWASSLAACGVLSELGWEIESYIEILYERFFTEAGAKRITSGLLIMITVHHCLASGLGLPMVLYYRELKALHWLCFDLQITAAANFMVEYSKILDITKPGELLQFKVISVIMLVMTMWTRALHWVILCIQVMLTWYHDKAWTFVAVGSIIIPVFTFFNVSVCVVPMYKRFMKFITMSAEYESLPPDVSEKKRRQSAINLEDSAIELLIEESIYLEDRIQLFLESLDRRDKLVRRQTVPSRSMMVWASSTRLMRGASAPANVLKTD